MTLESALSAVLHTIDLASLSIVSPEVALYRPISDLVDAALIAVGRSIHTQRSYRTGITLFLQFLDAERGHLLPPEAAAWRPDRERPSLSMARRDDEDAKKRPHRMNQEAENEAKP